jgi:hypothetical protein
MNFNVSAIIRNTFERSVIGSLRDRSIAQLLLVKLRLCEAAERTEAESDQ